MKRILIFLTSSVLIFLCGMICGNFINNRIQTRHRAEELYSALEIDNYQGVGYLCTDDVLTWLKGRERKLGAVNSFQILGIGSIPWGTASWAIVRVTRTKGVFTERPMAGISQEFDSFPVPDTDSRY